MAFGGLVNHDDFESENFRFFELIKVYLFKMSNLQFNTFF
jgi:hypothetical protein